MIRVARLNIAPIRLLLCGVVKLRLLDIRHK